MYFGGLILCLLTTSGVRATNGGELTLPNLVNPRSHEIISESYWVTLKNDRLLRSVTAETPVEFQNHPIIPNIDLAASRVGEIWERSGLPSVKCTPKVHIGPHFQHGVFIQEVCRSPRRRQMEAICVFSA